MNATVLLLYDAASRCKLHDKPLQQKVDRAHDACYSSGKVEWALLYPWEMGDYAVIAQQAVVRGLTKALLAVVTRCLQRRAADCQLLRRCCRLRHIHAWLQGTSITVCSPRDHHGCLALTDCNEQFVSLRKSGVSILTGGSAGQTGDAG